MNIKRVLSASLFGFLLFTLFIINYKLFFIVLGLMILKGIWDLMVKWAYWYQTYHTRKHLIDNN